MAKVIFSDGSEKIVSYNQAAEIYQILTGAAKPKNEAQVKFCEKVKEVVFDKSIKPT